MHSELKNSQLFKRMPTKVLKFLAKESKAVQLKGGDILFKEGDEADGLYIVISGRLRASNDSNTIGEISPGETVGELALIQNTARSLTVRAIRDTDLAYISQQTFEKMVGKYPDVLVPITQLIIQRYKSLMLGGSRTAAISTLAIIAANDDVDLKQFVNKLQEAFGDSSFKMETEWFEQQQEASEDRVAFLHQLEEKYSLLIFICNPSMDECSQFFMRQADRVLYIGNGNSTADLQNFSSWQQYDYIAEWDLVLLYNDTTIPPKGTSEWLQNDNFNRWHHIALSKTGHFSRLMRWLKGTTVGLVLSGGGAKGYAHIGFMQALTEANIDVDVVGGVSIGSVIGSQIAQEWNHQTIMEVTRRTFTRRNPIGDYTLPLVSLVSGRRVSGLLKANLGDRDIEDSWITFFCQSCNLSRSSVHVFRRGTIWRAVRASIAIPGMLSPSIYDGEVHVDGGVIDSLPIETMIKTGVKTIIAVDTASENSLKIECPNTDSISPWMLLKHKFMKKNRGLPNILNTLIHSGLMGSNVLLKQGQQQASHYVRIKVGRVGMLNWKALDSAVEAGYQQGKNFVSSLDNNML
jgi:predicted acylesterase/phospholipase RssA/CRP-like cAMP-binding protein|tara:strand:+ start:1302 stop:3029 length:1728 start_codon:yes stop_codon:yes gene_type:complete